MNYLELQEKNVLENKTLKIVLDSKIYSKSTVLKSTYKFTDRAYIYISLNNTSDNKKFVIYINPKEGSDISILSGDFMNELLDQELRATVLEQTHKIRDVIVTRALLSGQSNE